MAMVTDAATGAVRDPAPVLRCVYPEVELLAHRVALFLSFGEVPRRFPQHLHRHPRHRPPPPHSAYGPTCSTSSPALVMFCLLVVAIPARGLDLHFPGDR